MTTDAERLRAAGHVVAFADGDVPLIFDFAAWLLLEQEFGGMSVINERLTWKPDTVLADILAFLTAGVSHAGMTKAEVKARIRLSDLRSYQQAITDAVAEAFAEPGKAGSGEATGSTGEPSTTSPQSDTAAQIATSGV